MLLKLLLAMPRPVGSLKPTALGACALHANDYVESEKLEDLANDLLPVVCEFAAAWEIHNPRHVGAMLHRARYIYTQLLPNDLRVGQLVSGRLGSTLADLKFAGYSYEQYFAALFGLYAAVRAGVLKESTSIVDANDLSSRAQFEQETYRDFLSVKSDTAEGFAAAIGGIANVSQFIDSVTNNAWCADVRIFRAKPLLRLANDRFIVLDMQFLIENASAGLYWSLASQFSDSDRLALFTYWGALFETYVQRLVTYYAKGDCDVRVAVPAGEADIIVRAGPDLILFEVKSGFIAQDVKGTRNRDAFDKEIRKKYVSNQAGHPKGLTQLARVSRDLPHGARETYRTFEVIYPVLVVEDPVLQTFAMNSYLDEIFRQETSPASHVKPLTVLTVDELEEILPHVYAGDMSWQDILESRFLNNGVVVDPMHTSFVQFARKRGLQRRRDAFLRSSADDLDAIIARQYESLRAIAAWPQPNSR